MDEVNQFVIRKKELPGCIRYFLSIYNPVFYENCSGFLLMDNMSLEKLEGTLSSIFFNTFASNTKLPFPGILLI